jgi:hypothetical protein
MIQHNFDRPGPCPHPDCGSSGTGDVTGYQCAECGHYFPRSRVVMGDDSEPRCRAGMGHEARRVTVRRSQLVNTAPGRREPGWLYETTGPDGTRFDNRSIATLRDVLRRKYGRGLVIVEPWKEEKKS